MLSTSNASPPGWSIRRPQLRALLPGRLELKSSSFPSGDQRGFMLSMLGEVNRCGSPPSVPTTQISEWRLFSASRTVVTVTATQRPSGETAEELSVVTRYQSLGVKARPWAVRGKRRAGGPL